jgi:hypothetical protein
MAMAAAVLGTSPALAAGPGFQTLTAGTPSATAMPGWTVTSGSVDWISTYWQEPAGVTTSIDMNGTASAGHPSAAGTISQTITGLTTDEFYAVTFEIAGNPMCGPATKGLTVNAFDPANFPTSAAPTHISFTNTSSTTLSNMGWTQVGNLQFLPSGGSVPFSPGSFTLTFTADASNTSNCGMAIANIVVTPTGNFIPVFE